MGRKTPARDDRLDPRDEVAIEDRESGTRAGRARDPEIDLRGEREVDIRERDRFESDVQVAVRCDASGGNRRCQLGFLGHGEIIAENVSPGATERERRRSRGMHPEIWMLLSFVSAIFCIAVLVKAVEALRRREPYRFTTWDGGLMLRGAAVHAVVPIVLSIVLGVVSAALFVQWGRL